MGSRLKEEAKNEKAVRGQLKKTPNRRCINCNSLGPQYICLNFWTFVCTQCSGIHREFTHRVKSVSMSKFTSQEVANLEIGGNERGREIYFRDWDPQRQPLPDSRNIERLREFIKMVYVERRFSGERPPPRGKGGDREETYGTRQTEPQHKFQEDSRSPPFEARYAPGGRRSDAGYDGRGTHFEEKRSPGRFDIDKNKYDHNYSDNHQYAERSRYEERQTYGNNEGNEERFSYRGFRSHSPPPVRPVKEILGDDIPPLQVEINGRHNNGNRDMDNSDMIQHDRSQRSASSSSFGSVEGSVKSVSSALRRENSSSLIDFLSDPDPPPAAQYAPDPFELISATPALSDHVSSTTGWASFDTPSDSAPVHTSSVSVPVTSSTQTVFLGPVNGNTQWTPQWPDNSASTLSASNANNWQSLTGSTTLADSQLWNAFSAAVNPPATQVPGNLNSSTSLMFQASSPESPTKRVIPDDLFAQPQTSMQFIGGAYPSQYLSTSMSVVSYIPQQQKSVNPFDIPDDSLASSSHAELPSLTSMQGALPNLSMPLMSAPSAVPLSGSHWSQMRTIVPPQVPYSSTPDTRFNFQQLPNTPMQSGMTPFSDAGRLAESFTNLPKQNTTSFYPSTSFDQGVYQSSTGENTNHLFVSQGGVQFPFQRSDSFFPVQGQQRLISQHSVGSLSSILGSDPLFSNQTQHVGGHPLISHNSLDSLSNILGTDGQFSFQPFSKFPPESSLGSNGNPFG